MRKTNFGYMSLNFLTKYLNSPVKIYINLWLAHINKVKLIPIYYTLFYYWTNHVNMYGRISFCCNYNRLTSTSSWGRYHTYITRLPKKTFHRSSENLHVLIHGNKIKHTCPLQRFSTLLDLLVFLSMNSKTTAVTYRQAKTTWALEKTPEQTSLAEFVFLSLTTLFSDLLCQTIICINQFIRE